jgi:hypothetical protein
MLLLRWHGGSTSDQRPLRQAGANPYSSVCSVALAPEPRRYDPRSRPRASPPDGAGRGWHIPMLYTGSRWGWQGNARLAQRLFRGNRIVGCGSAGGYTTMSHEPCHQLPRWYRTALPTLIYGGPFPRPPGPLKPRLREPRHGGRLWLSDVTVVIHRLTPTSSTVCEVVCRSTPKPEGKEVRDFRPHSGTVG